MTHVFVWSNASRASGLDSAAALPTFVTEQLRGALVSS
jgi:hypothetical protein